MQIISILFLIFIGLLTYFLLMKISFKRKRRISITEVLNPKKATNILVDYFGDKEWVKFFSPNRIITESQKVGSGYTKSKFIATFILSSAITMIVLAVYFASFKIMFLGVLGGFILPNYQLYKNIKLYREDTQDKINIYLKSFAASMVTYQNVNEALKNILPDLEAPIYHDVEEALLKLQDGLSVKMAFEDFVNKYYSSELKLFHDILDGINENGSTEVDTLRVVAQKYKKKKTYRKRIQTESAKYKKNFKTLATLTITLPFLLMFLSFEYYLTFAHHIAGRMVLILSVMIVIASYIQIEKLSIYDPSEERNNINI